MEIIKNIFVEKMEKIFDGYKFQIGTTSIHSKLWMEKLWMDGMIACIEMNKYNFKFTYNYLKDYLDNKCVSMSKNDHLFLSEKINHMCCLNL
jgi:hypothetical protein